jgi:hypothetical protein
MDAQYTDSNERIVSYTSEELRQRSAEGKTLTDWTKLANLPNDEIDDSDLPEDFWEHARVITPKRKTQISFRVDKELLAWFKQAAATENKASGAKGYQSMITKS